MPVGGSFLPTANSQTLPWGKELWNEKASLIKSILQKDAVTLRLKNLGTPPTSQLPRAIAACVREAVLEPLLLAANTWIQRPRSKREGSSFLSWDAAARDRVGRDFTPDVLPLVIHNGCTQTLPRSSKGKSTKRLAAAGDITPVVTWIRETYGDVHMPLTPVPRNWWGSGHGTSSSASGDLSDGHMHVWGIRSASALGGAPRRLRGCFVHPAPRVSPLRLPGSSTRPAPGDLVQYSRTG